MNKYKLRLKEKGIAQPIWCAWKENIYDSN